MAYSGRFFPDRLDLHMLRTLAGPLALSLGVLLIAQLLERLLRLLDLAAASGADFSIVIRMAGTDSGRLGYFTRCMPASTGVRPPFLRLHDTQHVTMFSQSLRPP